MGDVTAVLSMSLMINNLEINWKIAFLINLAIFLIFAVIQYLAVDEIDMDEENKKINGST